MTLTTIIIKLLFLLFIFISQGYCGWKTLDKFSYNLQKQYFLDWDFDGYNGSDDVINQCGSKQIIGGFNKFGQGTSIQKSYTSIPTHTKIRLMFNLWLIDFWTISEGFFIDIDGKREYESYKQDMMAGSELCGSIKTPIFYEEIIPITLELPHTQSTLNITLYSNVYGALNIASYGISDYKLEYYDDSDPCAHKQNHNNQIMQPLCIDEDNIQHCTDMLMNLDPSPENNTSITNVCDVLYDNNDDIYYLFTISYLPPFEFDESCYQHQVNYQDLPLKESSTPTNQYDLFYFNSDTQQIQYKIKHSDFKDKYQCTFIDQNTELVWICDMDLTIFFHGHAQLTYSFKIMVTLDKIHSNTVQINIQQNTVQGQCCENPLSIQTALNFCTDYTCTSYINENPLQVYRKQDIYLEHKITSPAFQDYYLEGLKVQLGPFYPQIISKNEQNKGKVIFHIKSNIAKQNLILQVISKIHNEPITNNTRFLQQNNNNNDQKLQDEDGESNYKLTAFNQLTVLDREYQEPKVQDSNVRKIQKFFKSHKIPIIVLSATVFTLTITLFIVVKLYKNSILKNNIDQESSQQQKNQEDNQCKENNDNNSLYPRQKQPSSLSFSVDKSIDQLNNF